MSDCKYLRNTRITLTKTRLMFTSQIFVLKKRECRWAENKLVNSLILFVYHSSYGLEQYFPFPSGSKCTSSHRVSKYESKWMRDGVSAKLNHSNRNIIKVMCPTYILGSYCFDNIWFTESY